jgi:uracil-DNA glycosylase
MDPRRLAHIALQNAQTARLLGVDFVPVYRRAGGNDQVAQQDAADPPIVEVLPPKPAATPHAFDTKPVARTREAVEAALQAIRERYDLECPHQHFVTAHNTIVFGEGNPLARLMFIGEAPGAEEDKCGRPFVGRAGQLLNKMIDAMGLSREDVYISNVLKTRPPDNATPTSDEIRLCAPYLYQQIAVIRPEVIVTLGLPATRALLNTAEPMSRLRGRWFPFRAPPPADCDVPVMPTYHPAFLLRSYTPDNRAKVWADLKTVMERLGIAEAPKAGG